MPLKALIRKFSVEGWEREGILCRFVGETFHGLFWPANLTSSTTLPTLKSSFISIGIVGYSFKWYLS